MKKLNLLTAILLVLIVSSCEKDETKPIPTAPKLLEPADGSVAGPDTVAFKWEKSPSLGGDEIFYILYISDDSLNWHSDQNLNKTTLTTPSNFASDFTLMTEKKYYWKVYASKSKDRDYDYDAPGVFSEVFHFYTAPKGVEELLDTTGHDFVNLYWKEPEGTELVEVTFEPEVSGIAQPIKVSAGIGKAKIKGLEYGTLYTFYVKAYNRKGHGSLNDTIKAMPLMPDEVYDANLNIYTTTKIGNQTWMRENLRATKFQDGTPIKEFYIGSKSDKYGYYYNITEILDYAYYNNIVETLEYPVKNICPCGYHIPTDEEFKELERFLGMSEEDLDTLAYNVYRGDEETVKAGYVLKSENDWLDYEGKSGNGNDLNGFRLYPSGAFVYDINSKSWVEYHLGESAEIVTSTKNGDGDYISRKFYYWSTGIRRAEYNFLRRLSFRCIKD